MKENIRYILLSVAILMIIGVILIIQKPDKKTEIVRGEALGVKKAPEAGIEIGAMAPNFILQDLDGNLVKLSDLKGKAVVINFWASWCQFCLDEMPDFQKVAQKYDGKAIILGVNRGEKPETALDYARNKLPVSVMYPILLDSNEDVSNVYVLRGMPVTYFINKDGIITNRFFGKITREIMEQEIEEALLS